MDSVFKYFYQSTSQQSKNWICQISVMQKKIKLPLLSQRPCTPLRSVQGITVEPLNKINKDMG